MDERPHKNFLKSTKLPDIKVTKTRSWHQAKREIIEFQKKQTHSNRTEEEDDSYDDDYDDDTTDECDCDDTTDVSDNDSDNESDMSLIKHVKQ